MHAGLDLDQATHTLRLTSARIVNRVTFTDATGINAEEYQTTKLIRPEFETKSNELTIVIRHRCHDVLRFIDHVTFLGLNVEWSWKVINDGVDQILNTFVLESRTASHWDDLIGDHRAAKCGLQFLNADRLFFKELHAELFVLAANFIKKTLVSFFTFGDFVAFEITNGVFRTKHGIITVDDCFLIHHVDLTDEIIFRTNWNEDRPGVGTELRANIFNNVVKVGTSAVHLIDESNTRNAVFLSLAINSFRLRLNASNTAKNEDSTVKNTKGAFYFSREVHVSRGINDVNADIFFFAKLEDAGLFELLPAGSNSSGGDGDTTLFFLLHPVCRSSAVMNFTDFVNHACVEQDSLRQRGLARIDMGTDPDITGALKRVFTVRGVQIGHVSGKLWCVERKRKGDF